MTEPAVDWSSASVSDGQLAVTIDGELPSGWQAAFESTITLLDRGDSLEIKLKKSRLRVRGVTPGDEEKVRHLLEGAVQQANADCMSDEEDSDADEEDTEGETEPDTESDDDARMTERFRSFGDR